MIKKSDKYINENIDRVNNKFKPLYHFSAPIGWINDPNGFVQINEELHLFYQYYPYDSVWGPMHWGHAKTLNGFNWQHLPVALEPDMPYDENGCFSGSSIFVNNQLHLFYTGHIENDVLRKETQCHAISRDKNFTVFQKNEKNPIISDNVMNGMASLEDFRDPKVFEYNETYYMVTASKDENDRGQILLFSSENIEDWKFESVLIKANENQGSVWECPDLFELDGKWVLICSPIKYPSEGNKFTNINSSIAIIGEMDWENKKFIPENIHEIDGGLDFYAPQTCLFNGKRVLIAWAQMWERNIPSNELKHNWAGAMTMIRELSVKNNYLIQKPLFTHKESELFSINETKEGHSLDFKTNVNSGLLKISIQESIENQLHLEFGNNSESIEIDILNNTVNYNRKNSIKINNSNSTPSIERSMDIFKKLETVDIYFDKSILEIYINNEQVMTNTFYFNDDINHIYVNSTNNCKAQLYKLKQDE